MQLRSGCPGFHTFSQEMISPGETLVLLALTVGPVGRESLTRKRRLPSRLSIPITKG